MQMQIVNGINMLMFSAAPIAVAMAAFGMYSWLGGQLTPDVAFPALAYFDLLRFPLVMLPWQIMEFVSACVALTRLQKFVDSEETDALSGCGAKEVAKRVLLLHFLFCSKLY
jgi:ABC-type multidrug transport system fused ATPase/permease subunit